MVDPGWYNAAGDPPGSQRYWDGNGWIGEPVFEPAPSPLAVPTMPTMPPPAPGGYAYVGGPAAAPSVFSGWLKATAIVVSVLKAIPLLFGLLGLVLLSAVTGSIDDDFDDVGFGFDSVLGAAIAIILVVLVIGALLLGFQFVGALKERPMMVFVPALIMALMDSLLTVGSWAAWNEARSSAFGNDSATSPILITAVAAAQIYIAVQAIRANSK